MVKFKFTFLTLLTIILIIILDIKIGQLPPLGRFLDPVKGVWQNALIADIPSGDQIHLKGLQQEVKIVFNTRGVPHIFAQNDHDLYLAAGYVTAMHRLWQMEFSSHAAMGRLSEIVGERALEYDKYNRRMGMVYGAEKMLEASMHDEKVMTALNAYTMGVNLYISSLSEADYPFEYKLLDYAPELWTPIKTLAMGMNINKILSSGSRALQMSYLESAWGREAIVALYTEKDESLEPIISRNHKWDFDIKAPAPPGDLFLPGYVSKDITVSRDPGIGSNNWAVSGEKTLSGDALLASDPHLGLSLPSVWYEIQLNAPGINSYGVTFPGVPLIIIGFNEHIAWGNTNTGNEVFDIYEIETDEDYENYLFDGQWQPLTFRTEIYKVRGGETITDTVAYTHHGPIMYRDGEKPFSTNIPVSHAIGWTAHETGNVLRPLHRISLSTNVQQFRDALSELNAPPQNYAVATTEGDIAIQLNGLWPVKWSQQGMFINNGRDSRYDWDGFIPFRYLPHEINPPRGYISSANQHTTLSNYPFYHGWFFASPARASVINNTLEASDTLTVEDMMHLQNNVQNFWAQNYLHQMVDSALVYAQKFPDSIRSSFFQPAIDSLVRWDKLNEAYSVETTIFEKWKNEVITDLWAPLLEPIKELRTVRPTTMNSFRVLFHKAPVNTYTRLFGTLPNTSELLAKGLDKILTQLEEENGKWSREWHWWRFNGSTIRHSLNIPALNEPRLQVGGSSESPRAISNNHGPSWRMVAQLADTIKAWGIYPGGQTGNPASPGYNAFINDWANEIYYPLTLYRSYEQATYDNQDILTLLPE